MHILETGHQLKSQQMAKGKGDFTLPMRIHIIAIHLHGRAVPQHAFNHRSDFR